MRNKYSILIIFLLIPFISIFAQNESHTKDKGFYLGLDLILTSVDKWGFDRNDLNLDIFEEAPLGKGYTASPILGYRFGGNLRVEFSYWRKEYYNTIGKDNQRLSQYRAFGANVFSGRVKYDLPIFRERLFIAPCIGVSFAHRTDGITSDTNVREFKRTSIYHRTNFATIDLGFGINAKLFNSLYFSSNLIVYNGLDQVMSVRYDLADLSSNDHSRIESKGTTLAISIGLKYNL